MLEAIRLVLLSSAVGGTLLAVIIVILKQAPEALKTVMGVLTRHRLIRQAVEAEDKGVRQRAGAVLKMLERRDHLPAEKKRRGKSVDGPDG